MPLDDRQYRYDPSIFDVGSVEQARWVILNPDGVHTPDERWQIETRYILDRLEVYLPGRGATCLDYGCGIGRLAKPLIAERGWRVIGADISPSMRSFAVSQVDSDKFLACDPGALDVMGYSGLRFDYALAVWSLQHMRDVASDLERICALLKDGGRLFVLNATERFVPTREVPWANDGVNVWDLLSKILVAVRVEAVDQAIVPAPAALWGVFERPVCPA